jgi:hypothetical protein
MVHSNPSGDPPKCGVHPPMPVDVQREKLDHVDDRMELCFTGPDSAYEFHRYFLTRAFTATPAPEPIQDYTGQPYSANTSGYVPGAPASQVEAEQRTRDMLHSGELPDVNEQYDALLNVPGACDLFNKLSCGATERPADKKCDLSTGMRQDPSPAADRFAVHTPLTRRDDSGQVVPTALLYGHTYEARNGKWRGWGYRHIAAEHGWGPAEQAATEAALALPPLPEGPAGSDPPYTWVYVGPEYEQAGTTCARRVVVASPQAPDLSHEPRAKEILTSYGWDKLAP